MAHRRSPDLRRLHRDVCHDDQHVAVMDSAKSLSTGTVDCGRCESAAMAGTRGGLWMCFGDGRRMRSSHCLAHTTYQPGDRIGDAGISIYCRSTPPSSVGLPLCNLDLGAGILWKESGYVFAMADNQHLRLLGGREI